MKKTLRIVEKMPRKQKPFSPYAPLLYLTALMWAVELVNLLLGHFLCRYGILPRTLPGLAGIPFSPLLHGSVAHLFMNTAPFVVLGGLVLANGRSTFLRVSVLIVFAGGLGIWLVGRPAVHVGASSLIFGYFGYLLTSGLVKRGIKPLLLALVALAAYGSLFWGLLPTLSHVSWEGHLCGFAAGIMATRFEKRRGR